LTHPFLSIIIPAHNEEGRLPRTLWQVIAFLEKQTYTAEIIIVENNSVDRTLELAREFEKRHSNVIVIHEEKRGKGNAVQRGMLAAHGEYRFICDADLIPPRLNDFDLAIASREAPGAIRYNEPSFRHWGGRAINLAIRLLILPGINDTQCGFKCFRADVAEILFRQQTLMGWSFDIELLYLARRKKMRIKEIPIQWYFDADSKIRAVKDALKMLGDIFRIHINAMRGRYDLKP
jgi:dolichyl-phosphate beta-glucosyltransferase